VAEGGALVSRLDAACTTWLYTIARNACVDGARRERSRATEPLEHEPAASSSSDPERAAASAELRPVLESAIAALPEAQREVFLLREMAGIPFHEIARLTNAPEPTVKSRMRYALEALRAHLTTAGIESPAGGQVA
jgi:RNA polymerase sigma-70 factor (ECF subfamily)